MKLADLMREDWICTDLTEGTKEGVLRALVDHLVDHGEVDNADEVLRALLEREQLMTTGVHTGFAIPHAFSSHVHRSLVALGHIPGGADWKALDQKPVHYAFLMLGPPEAQGAHLRLLARVSRLLSSAEFVHRLARTNTAAEILEAVRASEAAVALEKPASS